MIFRIRACSCWDLNTSLAYWCGHFPQQVSISLFSRLHLNDMHKHLCGASSVTHLLQVLSTRAGASSMRTVFDAGPNDPQPARFSALILRLNMNESH